LRRGAVFGLARGDTASELRVGLGPFFHGKAKPKRTVSVRPRPVRLGSMKYERVRERKAGHVADG
jgi:hypothetical protein